MPAVCFPAATLQRDVVDRFLIGVEVRRHACVVEFDQFDDPAVDAVCQRVGAALKHAVFLHVLDKTGRRRPWIRAIVQKPIERIRSLFDTLKEKMVGTQHNEVANWLKHPSGPPTATISELEALAMIQRAISKYSATYNGATTNMQNFLAGQEARLRGKA